MNKSEVAIVGFACRLPGAASSHALWKLLWENRCSVSQIGADRFGTRCFLHPDDDQRGRTYTFACGTIDDVWGFDAAAFGMSPREAVQVDPQQRHILEVTYDALAHAGIRPSTLAGSDTGVYVGASSADHAVRFFVDPAAADMHMMTGNSLSIISNRLSYALDLHGPSLTVDTACSSSMVALDLAAEAIRSGAIDTAIVAGVNLVLSPFSYIGFSRASMLSPTGLCRPFAAGDGYVRAEGAITVVLRSMAAAHRARNRIRAVIVGSGINQDGRTNGMALPSEESQRHLLERVYDRFSVDPADLSFVEAHGTGTPVGDPLEATALGRGLGQRRSSPLPIGSIKSNVGHLEPASGLAGLMKAIQVLEHRLIPATLHQKEPNPDIDFEELNLEVVGRNRALQDRRGHDLVGINSFGFGGTNAHAILRSERTVSGFVNVGLPPLLLTAHDTEALASLASAYLEQWPSDMIEVPAFLGASAYQRDSLSHRAIARGATAGDVRRQLEGLARGETGGGILTGQALGDDLPVAFLFSGNGAQWDGMGRQAWAANRVFQESLTAIDKAFSRVQDWSIIDLLFAENLATRLRQATYSQPLLLAVQIATVRALEASGIKPSLVMGHSVGEIAAAWCAGALSLEQAIDVVRARSHHQEAVRDAGAMVVLMLSEREARRFLARAGAEEIEIAAVNSWRSVTVSGPHPAIDKVLEAAGRMRIGTRRLDLDYPFHSALVEPVRSPLLRDLEGLRPLNPRLRFVSSVTGDEIEGAALTADHWWRNVREPVKFAAGLGKIFEGGIRLFVEIGPKPILTSYVRDALREAGLRGAIVETLGEADATSDGDPIESCAARIVLSGGRIDRESFFGSPPSCTVALPLYPWQHVQFKVQPTDEAATVLLEPPHPLLGLRPRKDGSEWYGTIDPVLYPWINDHRVGGIALLPATAFVEILLAAGAESLGDGPLELRDLDIVRPLMFDGSTSFETKIRLAPETGVVEFLSRARTAGADWSLHARAIVLRCPATAAVSSVPIVTSSTVVVLKPDVYSAAREHGYEYGEAFQRAAQVAYPHPKVSVTTLDPLAGLIEGTRLIDVTALDSAFHALLASERAGVADQPMVRMLPIRFESVRVFVSGVAIARVSARTVRQSSTSIVLSIDLWDEADRHVLSAENVRLIAAPVDMPATEQSLGYHLEALALDEPGRSAPGALLLPNDAAVSTGDDAPANLTEGLLIVEAGSLRAAWNVLSRAPREPLAGDDAERPGWSGFLRAALLEHLESRGLLAPTSAAPQECDLPEVHSIVATLVERHPMMAAEAAAVSRLEDIIASLIAGNAAIAAEVQAGHWKKLNASARQVERLRQAVARDVTARLAACRPHHLLRLLLIGAEHAAMAVDLCRRFHNLEVVLTDIDADRLDQARAALADGAPHVRSVDWTELDALQAATLDMAAAVDALSEVAAGAGKLAKLVRLLRPGAPMIAGELAPSAFWDVVRGTRPLWWARSARADVPVGALLTAQEWNDELRESGLSRVTVQSLGEEGRVGFLLVAIAERAAERITPGTPTFHWTGAAHVDFAAAVAKLLAPAASPTATPPSMPAATTDIVLALRATDEVAGVAAALESFAGQCRTLTEGVARLWVLAELEGDDIDPLEQPFWCALASAARVAQNEYARIEIRCLGFAAADRVTMVGRIAEELVAPSHERELFYRGETRLVFRLERGVAAPAADVARKENEFLYLAPRRSSRSGLLSWLAAERPGIAAHEVEIAVAFTGLNFRDVLWNLGFLPEEALEDGYAGAGLGMECTGTIIRVGQDVTGLSVGDRVVAFAPRAFASHVVAPAFAVSPLPPQLSLEAATTLPVAFLTAYYALVHLGNLRAGDTVLIHGGAGAVGLAALQIARHFGAVSIVTAGSEEKRALLADIGADFVCNSRTLSFARDVERFTGGRGVDVVLNSLAGEAMMRSLDCLRPFGRFIELGKRDFYANTQLGLRPLRRNISYFGVDVDQLINHDRQLVERLFREILELFAEGALTPLPYSLFDGGEANQAFQLMQRAAHIGKIVISPVDRAAVPVAVNSFPVSASGAHVVIGGTSGFGLATAEWLADRGATRIVLASRSGQVVEGAAGALARLRERGIAIEITSVDAGDRDSLRLLLQRSQSLGPIKGIVNAAMVLDDRLMQGIDLPSITSVLMPKAAAALHLEHLAGGLSLDYLLLFSSATTFFGNPGQFNYVAANGFVEGVARRMRARGQPALTVAWGAIQDVGYLARHLEENVTLNKRFGRTLLLARTALDGLDWAFTADRLQRTAAYGLARVDWAMAKRELPAVQTPTFAVFDTVAEARQGGQDTVLADRLYGLSLEEATEVLVDVIVEEIAKVAGLPAKEIDRHRPLAEIGMDSLMMLELRMVVESSLQINAPMMLLSSGITPTDIARRIVPLVMGGETAVTAPSSLVALSASHLAEDVAVVDASQQHAAVSSVLERAHQLGSPR